MILGISFDNEKDNKSFSNKFGFNFPLLSDTDRKVGLAYGATEPGASGNAKRIAYVIDPQGKIKEAHEKVDSKTYPQEQLKTL